MSTAIEIKGACCCVYTDCVMVSEQNHSVKTLKKEYQALRGIDDLAMLPSNMINDTMEDFKEWLEKKGFKKLILKEIFIGD